MQVTCKTCFTSINVEEGVNVHAALECGCCPEDHHHGEAAAACPKEHEGPCWNPPTLPVKPDGCTVCRPLIIFPVTGTLTMTGG